MGEHAMLVRSPVGELREVLIDTLRVRVEDVRPVLVDEHARVVVMVVRVAADVRAAVDEQHLLIELRREPFRRHTAGETCPNDEVIEHEHWYRPLIFFL